MERHARFTVLEGAVKACRHDVDESAQVRSYRERPSEGLLGMAHGEQAVIASVSPEQGSRIVRA
jgi:hypothetical protein